MEPINIFRARAENIDEPSVKAITRHAEVDGLKGMPHNNVDGVVAVVDVPLHVGCHDPVLGATPDA